MPKYCEEISAVTPSRKRVSRKSEGEQKRIRKEDDRVEPMKKKQKTNEKRSKAKEGKEDARCSHDCPDKTKIDMIKILLKMEELSSSIKENSSLISQLKNILHPENVFSRERDGGCIKQENEIIKVEPEVDMMNVVEKTKHLPFSVQKVINCLLCSNKDGKNLCGYDAVRYHVSECLLATGAYLTFLPHMQGQTGEMEEFGKKFRYKCQGENCGKKSKAMGYREFSMHMGLHHGILERWAKESDMEGAQDLYNVLKNGREEIGQTLPKNTNYVVEEIHTCLLCHGTGEGGKEARILSFAPEKIKITRNHYF